jgi:predicted Rossmann-fold nucleotide-binding protein
MPRPFVVSGGQAGVDRGALDAALAAGAPCGGACPAGRRAEDGRIPDRYPLTALDDPGYAARTEANVRDSDATLVLCPGPPAGGTALTLRFAERHRRPVCLIDAGRLTPEQAAREVRRFVAEHDVRRLNVAGPRASGWPEGADYARRAVTALLYADRRPPEPDR